MAKVSMNLIQRHFITRGRSALKLLASMHAIPAITLMKNFSNIEAVLIMIMISTLILNLILLFFH
jgi:hypothetical protein